MTLIQRLVGGLAAAGLVVAAPTQASDDASAHRLTRRAPMVALQEHTVALTRLPVKRPRNRPWTSTGGSDTANTQQKRSPPIFSGPALAAIHQIEYIAPVQAGKNNLSLIIDTGSSDTWFVHEKYQCLDFLGFATNAADCAMGPPFKGDFPGGKITNEFFAVTYGDVNGPSLSGPMGYSDVTVSNMRTPKQQIGLATSGTFRGDSLTSGILGLGLPGLTTAIRGDANSLSGGTISSGSMLHYSPLVTTLAKQNTSVFSLALSRDPNGSFLAFGGVPEAAKTDNNWVTVPINKYSTPDPTSLGGSSVTDYMYYQIPIDKMVWNSSLLARNGSNIPDFIVDSGTTMNMMPYELAESINSLYTPHAVYDPDQGVWVVNCNAKPPTLGIQIGGHMFYTDPSSMILTAVTNGKGKCASGIGTRSEPPYILGDTFMQQIVAVFDVTNKEIKFAKRI